MNKWVKVTFKCYIKNVQTSSPNPSWHLFFPQSYSEHLRVLWKAGPHNVPPSPPPERGPFLYFHQGSHDLLFPLVAKKKKKTDTTVDKLPAMKCGKLHTNTKKTEVTDKILFLNILNSVWVKSLNCLIRVTNDEKTPWLNLNLLQDRRPSGDSASPLLPLSIVSIVIMALSPSVHLFLLSVWMVLSCRFVIYKAIYIYVEMTWLN